MIKNLSLKKSKKNVGSFYTSIQKIAEKDIGKIIFLINIKNLTKFLTIV